MAQKVESGNIYDRLTRKNDPVKEEGIYSRLSRPAPSRPEKSAEAKVMQAEISPSRPEKSNRAIEMQGQLLREQGKSIYETLLQDERPLESIYAVPNNSKKESANHTYETIEKYSNKYNNKHGKGQESDYEDIEKFDNERADHVYEAIDKYRKDPKQIPSNTQSPEKIYAAPQGDGPIYSVPVQNVSLNKNANSEATKSARVAKEDIYSVPNKKVAKSSSESSGVGGSDKAPSSDPQKPSGNNLVNQRQATNVR